MSSVGGPHDAGWVPAGRVHPSTIDGHASVVLEGHLDAATGAELLEVVARLAAHDPSRIDIDLGVLVSFTADGAAALARCRDLCTAVPDGLHYRTEGGAGQLALLSAFEREPEVDTVG